MYSFTPLRSIVLNSKLNTRSFATTNKYKDLSLGKVLESKISEYQHRDSLFFLPQGYRWTFLELKNHVDSVGNGFLDQGFRKGSKVVALLNNEIENVVGLLGANKVGIQWVLLSANVQNEEIEKLLKDTEARGLIINPKIQTPENLKTILPELGTHSSGNPYRYANFEKLRNIFHVDFKRINGMIQYRDMIQPNRRPDLVPESLNNTKSTDVALIERNRTFTHENILNNAEQLISKAGLEIGTRIVTTLPLNNANAFAYSIWAPILSGSVTIIPSVQFNSEEILKAINNEKPTVLLTLSTQLTALSQDPKFKKSNISSIQKVVLVDDNKVQQDTLQQAEQLLGVKKVISLN